MNYDVFGYMHVSQLLYLGIPQCDAIATCILIWYTNTQNDTSKKAECAVCEGCSIQNKCLYFPTFYVKGLHAVSALHH